MRQHNIPRYNQTSMIVHPATLSLLTPRVTATIRPVPQLLYRTTHTTTPRRMMKSLLLPVYSLLSTSRPWTACMTTPHLPRHMCLHCRPVSPFLTCLTPNLIQPTIVRPPRTLPTLSPSPPTPRHPSPPLPTIRHTAMTGVTTPQGHLIHPWTSTQACQMDTCQLHRLIWAFLAQQLRTAITLTPTPILVCPSHNTVCPGTIRLHRSWPRSKMSAW